MARPIPSLVHNAALIATLAAAPVALVSVLPATAQAAPGPFAEPLIEMLPLGEPTADGKSPVTVGFVALGVDGAPLAGLTGKVEIGKANGKIVDAGGGMYTATLTPAAVLQSTDVTVDLKAKTPGGAITKAFTARVVPAASRGIGISSSPAEIVLGQDATSTLTFTLAGPAGKAAEAGELAVLASSGTVANITHLGDGRYSALYTAPTQLFPHNALITVVDKRNPDRSFGGVAIPLKGKANFPVVGKPNSNILLKIGDREFGPIPADAAGKAQIPIVVPPGVPQATVISVLNGQRTEDPLDLQIPATQRVKMVPTWATIPANDGRSTKLRALVTRPDGTPDTAANVRFTTTAGTVSAATHAGGGIFVADFTPPYGLVATNATVQVVVEDPAGPQTDSLNISLSPALPDTLTLTAEPPVLAANAPSLQLFAKLAGRAGAGAAGNGLRLDIAGGSQQGPTSNLGNGDFSAAITPDGQAPVRMVATARNPASGNPLRHIVVLPADDVLRSNAKDNTALAVFTLDAFGLPVAGVDVQLAVSGSDAGVPASVTTDDAGIGIVPLTSGQTPGAVRITATAGGHVGTGLVLQGQKQGIGVSDLPGSGSADFTSVSANWDRLFEAATVTRAGGGAAAAPVLSAAVGAPARVQLGAEPSSIAAGGSVTLRMQVFDAAGKPVPGQTFQFVASAGDVTGVQDLGGGNYSATFSVPMGTTGEVKVTAITGTGVAGLMSVPVSGSAITVPPPPATLPDRQAEAKPEKVKEPREPGEHPWLRVGGGFLGGVYSYRQTPSTQQGPLYTNSITVGGQVTDPAGATGFYLDGRAWLPSFEYVGFDASFRTARWSMNLAEGFDAPIPDFLNHAQVNVLGRYPFAVGDGGQMHIGARVGVDINDFLYFTQTAAAEDGSFSIQYQQLPVFGTSFGAELGAEVGSVFGLLGYEASFNDFTAVYSNELDAELGLALTESFYLSGRFGWANRFTNVYEERGGGKQEVGTLDDSFTSFGLGVGYQR